MTPSLRIGRLRTTCARARARSEPGPSASRLDALAADVLPGMLAEQLEATATPGVLLVRRLEVGFEMDAGWSDRQLAAAWAAHLAAALAAAEDRGEAVRFETRAAFLAQYLEDRAAGQAGGAWYFSAFEGLSVLSASAALRTAILDDSELGQAALATLGPTCCQRVVEALTEAHAAAVLAGLAALASEASPPPAAWESVREAAARVPAARLDRPERRALILFLETPPLVGVTAGDRARSARAWAFLGAARARPADGLIEALTGPSSAPLYRRVGTAAAEALGPLRDAHLVGRLPASEAPGGWLREVVPAPGPTAESNPAPRATSKTSNACLETRGTPFGVLFLILATLDTLPWDAATRGWRSTPEDSAATLARLAVAAQVAGGARAAEFVADPVVREVLDVSPRLTPETWARWARAVRPRQRAAFAREIAGHLDRGRRLGGEWLWTSVALAEAPVGLVLDAARGDWLDVRGACTAGAVARAVSSLPVRPDRLVVPPDRLAAFREAMPELEVVSVGEGSGGAALGETRARCARLAESVAHVRLARPWALPRALELAVALAAHVVVRDLAWRISGFERSSLPYVVRNLLDVPAQAEVGPGEWRVRVGRPPLQILLARTSIARTTVSPSWAAGVRYRLHS